MSFLLQAVAAYHCPRWEELPTLPLYMDQVIFVLEEALVPFAGEEKMLTPTMVNNYVKQKLLPAPEKKKYTRAHLATLMMLSMTKRALSMNEIAVLLQLLADSYGLEPAYNLFAQELERYLQCFAQGQVPPMSTAAQSPADKALHAALTALMGKLFLQAVLAEIPPPLSSAQEETAEKKTEKKPEKKAEKKPKKEK